MQTKSLAAALSLLLSHHVATAETVDTPLEDTVITATRLSQNPLKSLNDISIITRADIEASQAQFLPDLLQQTIGVETVSNGAQGTVGSLFTRGTNTNQTVILIDGVRLVSATTGTASYNHIPLNQIERIEVVRGASSSVHGADAIGGVVHIFTRKPSEQRISGDVGIKVGNNGTRGVDANVGGTVHGLQYQLSVGAERTDNGVSATNDAYPFGHHPDEDGYRNQNFSGRLAYEWAEGHNLSVQALRYKGEAQYDAGGSDPITWMPISLNDENYITHLTQLSITSQNRITDQITSNLQLSNSRDEGKSVTQGTTDYFIKSKDTRAQWVISGEHDSIQWQTGIEWLKQDINSDTDYERDSRKNWAYFGAINTQINQWLLESSIRQDNDSQYGNHTTGRMAVGYQFNDHLVGRLSYGTAFRVPTFNELYYPYGGGNPLLKPEKSRSWEAGLKYRHANLALDWTVFHTSIDQMINGWPAQNINQSKLLGTSLAVSKQWQQFKLYGNVTYQDPRDQTNDKLLIQRARVFGNVGVDYRPNEKWTVNTNLHVHGRSFADANNTQSLGGYGLLGASVAYQASDVLSVRLSGSNLLDKQYTTVYGYNTQGRSVVLSGRYQF